MDNYTILHLHSMDSNPYSGLEVDSITPFQAYIDKAKECGMKAIAFTEHGAVLHNISKRQACEKAGIKVLANGKLAKKITVKANRFSSAAITKIEELGGTTEVI